MPRKGRKKPFISSGVAPSGKIISERYWAGRFCNLLIGFLLTNPSTVTLASGEAQRTEPCPLIFAKYLALLEQEKTFNQTNKQTENYQGMTKNKSVDCESAWWQVNWVQKHLDSVCAMLGNSPFWRTEAHQHRQRAPPCWEIWKLGIKVLSLYMANLYPKWQLWLHLWDSFQGRK